MSSCLVLENFFSDSPQASWEDAVSSMDTNCQ